MIPLHYVKYIIDVIVSPFIVEPLKFAEKARLIDPTSYSVVSGG